MRMFDDGLLSRNLARAQDGDDAALEMLLGLLRPVLLRYARVQLAAEAEADETARDIAQEALIRVVGGLGRCRARADAQVLAWALTIARNLCTDHFRHARSSALSLASCLDEMESPAPEPNLPRKRPAARGARALNLVLREALDALPSSARSLLQLRFHEGMSWSEVARELGLTRNAAKRRFERVQERLRKDTLRRIDRLGDREREATLRYVRRSYR